MKKIFISVVFGCLILANTAQAQTALTFNCKKIYGLTLETCTCMEQTALKYVSSNDLIMVVNMSDSTREIMMSQNPNLQEAWKAWQVAFTVCNKSDN